MEEKKKSTEKGAPIPKYEGCNIGGVILIVHEQNLINTPLHASNITKENAIIFIMIMGKWKSSVNLPFTDSVIPKRFYSAGTLLVLQSYSYYYNITVSISTIF